MRRTRSAKSASSSAAVSVGFRRERVVVSKFEFGLAQPSLLVPVLQDIRVCSQVHVDHVHALDGALRPDPLCELHR